MFVTVKGRAYTDTTGACADLPVTLTPAGPLEPLLDYLLSHKNDRSIAWMIKVSRSVRMFLEYLQVNSAESNSYILFRNFANRLYTGTFDTTVGLDPSGLCWPPRSQTDAEHIITHLTDFFDWLCSQRPEAAKVNPRYAGGAFDRITDEAAYQFRRSKALLGHTWAKNLPSDQNGHFIRARRPPKVEKIDPPAFPDERFEDLLVKGFKVGGRSDLRGMLITLLLHGAGFRESEPFHLYISDVFPDPVNAGQAMVRIHHPSEGYAPFEKGLSGETMKSRNRAAYLAQEFGLAPRNELMGSRFAGWKGGTLDDKYYKRAYWFLPEYGEWFLHIWRHYLGQVAMVDRPHPFAFINLRHEPIGAMYTLAQYNKAHAAACERIGLTVSKALGTTPHGHRHAYGRRLKNAGIEKTFRRRFMHHVSPESQEVYTQATISELVAELGAALQRQREGQDVHPVRRNLQFTDSEPHEYSSLTGTNEDRQWSNP